MRPVQEWTELAPGRFADEILPSGRPAILRGLAGDWPLVRAAKAGHDRWLGLLLRHAGRAPVDMLFADPSQDGRFHYGPDGRSLNFQRGRTGLPRFLAALREYAKVDRPPAIVVQGLRADDHLPGFSTHHPMPLVPAGTEARIWIGNASKVATHNDPVDNIAVVVAGRRRFTLFPPECEGDLHMGPAHPTPAGTPVSMVHVTDPDLQRFPRYQTALQAAQEADLSSGDAIFIPRDWFHHVEALAPLNMLVNYWWDGSVRSS